MVLFRSLLLKAILVASVSSFPLPVWNVRCSTSTGTGTSAHHDLSIAARILNSAASLPAQDAGTSLSSSSLSDSDNSSLTSLYLDVSIPNRDNNAKDGDDSPLRLIFHVPTSPALLPLHTENIIKLFSQSQRSIDSRCSYVGCAFRHSPQFVEGFPQYRWAHVLDGRSINAVGRGSDRIEEKDAMSACRVDVVGSGSYYGIRYEDIPTVGDAYDNTGGGRGVALTVPLSGPGRGSTSLSVVRVGDSPQEWGERLLINSAVIGWMDPSCGEALRTMATQTDGPPSVVASGVL
eukprot:CAMPEP_0178518356 /NCGR_PEP_ID=MMETSP0696-20121128/26213_1 /TAXON_ID=265572 /ORGANISM="Extubocellulus spinifer, Strain CCMP396" /LENGTH=290 /DNA_ID=CAMNT_0020148913 /DNA_START=56 /DNA_END=928 /DNA_ORIENTATION=+